MTDAMVTEMSEFREHRGRVVGVRAGAASVWTLPEEPAAQPPTGTVTFVLTDIEGSTPRWETAPEEMAAAVGRHYEILDEAVARRGGVRPIEQGEGDSMVAAFARASDAVAAALAAQRGLAAEAWADGADISVRMALHTGEARLREGLYYVGPSIIRAARLRSLGHGGQVLLSAATADLLVDGLPAGAALLPLGAHRLKGLRHPERVFQLAHPGLRAQFPPLRSVDVLSTNLPAQLTSFVGREVELAAIADVMAGHRMVTLAGGGGTGKTRLALQAAGDDLQDYPDGIWWVELAPLTDPGAVPGAVMSALGLEDTRPGPAGRIVAYLRDRRALLVLDNCEHLLAAAGDLVGALLTGCPGIRVLATSREPLAVAGEVVWRVPPLSAPALNPPTTVVRGPADEAALFEEVRDTEAVRLFAERAAEARPGFQVDAANATVVAELCARLDGLPLAIELAAARVRALTPQRILDGLAKRFALLTGGAREAVTHHQTLAASMAWSHDLLTEPQQVLLRRLSVFTGRFDLSGVEAVASADPLTAWECLVLLADLVDRSLVDFDGEHYRLLATVADFAAERLGDAAEEAATRAAHLRYYAAVAADASAELNAAPKVETLERLELARGNVLAAIEHALAVGDHEAALAVTADTVTFWHMRSRYAESLAYLRRVLGATPDEPSRNRARVLWAVSQLALYGMDHANGYGIAESAQAVAMAEATGALDVLGRAVAMQHIPAVFMRPEQAMEHLPGAREIAERAGDRFGANLATVFLAFACTWGLDRPEVAEPELARLQAETSETGSPYWGFWHAICAGAAAQHRGRLRDAVELLAPEVEQARAFGDSQSEFFGAMPLADAYVDLGDAAAAERVIARSVAWQDRSALGRSECMRVRRARYLLAQGDLAGARAELGRIEAVLRSIGFDFIVVEWALVVARAAEEAGDLAAARAGVDEAAGLAVGLGMPWPLAWSAHADGRVARAEGRAGAAEDAHHRALALCAQHGYAGRAAETLECLASLAATGESWAEAARLYGAADAQRARTGFRRPPLDAPRAVADAAALCAELGPEAYAAAVSEGEALALDEAVAYASRARGERKRPSTGWESLTPTELQVVALVAAGLTNADIGQRLFITTGTVKVHLHNVFGKLGISRRSELAARATERRLSQT
jgi:predicted ATPase/class 3 adenylate cyclase/DNA-binding CsgD family transcriptional regulator